MAINLSPEIRANHPVYGEIDRVTGKVEDRVLIAENNIQNLINGQTDIEGLSDNILFTETRQPSHKSFNDDVILYLDFSDPLDPGFDYSNHEHHAINYGCTYESDPGRINSLKIVNPNFPYNSRTNAWGLTPAPTVTGTGTSSGQNYTMARRLSLEQHVTSLTTPEITIAGWFKLNPDFVDTATSTLFAFSDTTSTTWMRIFVQRSVGLTVEIYQNNVATYRVKHNIVLDDDEFNHFCFRMGATGNSLYINGETLPVYTVGNDTTYINLSTFNANQCTIGCFPKKYTGAYPGYSNQFDGSLTDFIIFNRVITNAELADIFDDNYGFDIIVLNGQSNMKGNSNLDPIDIDYTELYDKVYQYDCENNVASFVKTNPVTLADHIIKPAERPIGFPIDVAFTESCCWRTFCIDYIKYLKLPYRRKILLLPAAIPATSFKNADTTDGLWRPNKWLAQLTTVALNDIMSISPNSKIQALLWNQGESDITSYNLTYVADFNTYITNLMTNVPAFRPETPIILTKITSNFYDNILNGGVYFKTKIATDMATLTNPTNYPYRGLIDTINLTAFTDATRVHYDAASQRVLGQLNFDQYVILSGSKSTKSNTQLQVLNQDKKINTFIENAIFEKEVNFKGLTITEEIHAGPITMFGDLYLNQNEFGYDDVPLQNFCTVVKSFTPTGAWTTPFNVTFFKLNKLVMMTFQKITFMSLGGTFNFTITDTALKPINESTLTFISGSTETSAILLPSGAVEIKANSGGYAAVSTTIQGFTIWYITA
jgi:hypothetical protein